MKKVILILIILLALFLRFYQLDIYPALNADEAAIGYNAYSLIQTGADEHGNPWPIHFQSFNDFKPGLYFYVVLPFVKLLGLNEWSVRIPSAALGVGSVLIVYLLVIELGKLGLRLGAPRNSKKNYSEVIALTSAFFLAISPWHIHFSRGGWEVNVSTFFIATGTWLFLKALGNPKYYYLSVLSFVFSFYTYHAARIVAPLLVLGLIAIYKDNIKGNAKSVVIAGVFGVLLLIPLGFDLTQGSVLSRAAGVGLFADPGPLSRTNEQRGEHENLGGLGTVVLHNKPVNFGLAFLENWSEHYWGEFLFLSGDDIQRNKVPETGQMYIFEVFLVIFGLIGAIKYIWSNPKESKGWIFIFWWLLIAPIAAAFTFQSPHALRAQNMVIPLVIISSYGLIYLFVQVHEFISKKWLQDLIFLSFVVLISLSFARYLHMYWIHMAKEYPFSSQYGLKELVSYIRENNDKFESVIISDRYDQPYVLFLFYLQYPPEKFQSNHALTSRDKFGFSTVTEFDKYKFQRIDYDLVRPESPNSLIVGTDEEIPDEANIVKEIFGSNDYLYFQVVAN